MRRLSTEYEPFGEFYSFIAREKYNPPPPPQCRGPLTIKFWNSFLIG